MRACLKELGPELYDMITAPLRPTVRMMKAEVTETPLYGCVTWRPSVNHSAKFWTAHHEGFRSVHSYGAKALKTTRYESIETIIRKRRCFFTGTVARQ